MKALLTIEQLSAYIHKSVASIRSDTIRNPSSLPPICRLPGTKRLLWRSEDVESWVAKYIQGNLAETPAPAHNTDPKRKPGRPTKAEQIARQRKQTEASAVGHASASVGA